MDEGALQRADTNAIARLSLNASDACLLSVLDFIETLTSHLGFDSDEQTHIRLGLEETLTFLKDSALIGPSTPPFVLSCEEQADGITLRIIAKGLPLDIERMPEFSPENAAEKEELSGLSLFLVKQMMDKVVFSNHGNKGIEVELFKHLSSMHVQRIVPNEQVNLEQSSCRDISEYSIRPALEDEAVEISRCAYLTYGHSYEDYIYYPKRIVEMNRSGELHSLVAVGPDGTVMGHCALKFTPNRPERGELGVLFVRPEFRKQGLGASLLEAAVEHAKGLNLKCVFARSVTGHRASQMMFEQNGFSDCALSLALFPRSVDLKDLGGLQQGKMSGMMQSLNISNITESRINPPDRYRDIVAELYRRAGIEIVPNNDSLKDYSLATEPLMSVHRIPALNIGILEIERVGTKPEIAAHWVTRIWRRLCGEKLDTIYLYMSISEPGTASLAEHCVRNGFIFSGISPGAFRNGDALVLQYLNLPEDPFSSMSVWTDTASLLRDFIFDEWSALEKD